MDSHLPELAALLCDAVDSGGSVGFLPPLSAHGAAAYWRQVREAVAEGRRILFGAFGHAGLIGSVQLDLVATPNGLHRAEVMKLFVHRSARGRGVAKTLMRTLEREAAGNGRTLLVLDTRVGDAAERVYTALGYARAGEVPRYARGADGLLHPTVFMYKELSAPRSARGAPRPPQTRRRRSSRARRDDGQRRNRPTGRGS